MSDELLWSCGDGVTIRTPCSCVLQQISLGDLQYYSPLLHYHTLGSVRIWTPYYHRLL